MNDLVINDNSMLNARDFYNSLFEGIDSKTSFAHWFKRRRIDYELLEGVDFMPFLTKSTGGRPKIEYAISIECAKVLCLVDKTPKSKDYRKYLISVEKNLRKKELIRLTGIETRKGLTDTIQESGINEKMHGHGYSNFTKLVYKKAGIEYVKTTGFRNHLDHHQLKVIEQYEKLVDSYIQLGYDYSQIKELLPDTIKLLENKEV